MLKTYGVFGILQLIVFKLRTKLLFSKARLIRFPIRIRGKSLITVGSGFTTGFNCRIDAYSELNQKKVIEIGGNVQINDYVHIGAVESIEIGKNQDSPNSIPQERPIYSQKVVIEKNVWLGEFVSVLPGVTIGEGSIIGTMSVVNKDIPPFSIAVGSPARVIKKYNHEQNQWLKV